jgi:hypothetical protein
MPRTQLLSTAFCTPLNQFSKIEMDLVSVVCSMITKRVVAWVKRVRKRRSLLPNQASQANQETLKSKPFTTLVRLIHPCVF